MALQSLSQFWNGAARLVGASARARGDRARDAGDRDGAIRAYERHLASYPEDAAIWIQLGHAFKDSSHLDEALEAYEKASVLTPRDADLYLNLGHLYKMRGDVASALTMYERSTTLAPGLFSGCALFEAEKILARIVWRDSASEQRFVTGIGRLTEIIRDAEDAGASIFDCYFQSFQMR